MKTEESNQLISEFMGYKPNRYNSTPPIATDFVDNGTPAGLKISDMKYHTSWEWLMPVVEKIEKLGYTFEKNYQPVDDDWQCIIVKGNDILFQEFNIDSKLAAYEAVVEFIQWYNQKQNKDE